MQPNNDIKHLAILARIIPRFLEKLRAAPVAGYDAMEDAGRLMRQIEDIEAGHHPFRVMLCESEIAGVRDALQKHLS